jgi:hypothetical protein
MRNPLVVLSIATSFGLALVIASNTEPGSKVAAGLARGAIGGVILGSNAGAPSPTATKLKKNRSSLARYLVSILGSRSGNALLALGTHHSRLAFRFIPMSP